MTSENPRDPGDTKKLDDLVDRGPVETLTPSRTTLWLAIVAAVVLATMGAVGVMNAQGGQRTLADGEELLTAGRNELRAGPVTLTADLTGGDWIARQRCDRWVQLNDGTNDSSTLHMVWLDGVPRPADAAEVTLIPTPDDLPAWWRQQLGLSVTPLPATTMDGRAVSRYRLEATPAADRLDGLFACGRIDGPAGIGMYGPAARFDQQVAMVDIDGTPLMLVAAAYTGGDPDRLGTALDDVLASGVLTVDPAETP